jgi:hypothetical protein
VFDDIYAKCGSSEKAIMKRSTSIRFIKNELKKVNHLIDYKILHGLSYRHEARKHKVLLHRLTSLSRHSTFASLSLF